MDSTESNANVSISPEGSEELNGKDATYRTANMMSAPRTVMKRRIRGALVPIGRLE